MTKKGKGYRNSIKMSRNFLKAAEIVACEVKSASVSSNLMYIVLVKSLQNINFIRRELFVI